MCKSRDSTKSTSSYPKEIVSSGRDPTKLYPSTRTSFAQVSKQHETMSKNHDVSIKNLEVQIGQLSRQIVVLHGSCGGFAGNTVDILRMSLAKL